MKVEQIYTGCLAHGAYYIESNGEVAIVDPLREVQPYLDRAEQSGSKVKYVLETHFHADFVSGHLDMAAKTGAKIVFGPTAKPNFDAYVAQDGEKLKLGNVYIEVLHTPGHTMESSCFLLYNEAQQPVAVFSGDTLFINDVGRPDLAQKSDLTLRDLATHLYNSLRNKIMPLPDDVVVYPGHGAGSACGKNMAKETTDTIGRQKAVNYALRADMGAEEFIEAVTTGLMPPPSYFPQNARINREGYESIDTVMARGCQPMSPAAFEAAATESGAVVLDTREPSVFAKGFIPNSINIGIDGTFAPWVGALIPDVRQEILIVAEPEMVEEVVIRLARVGYDGAFGYLDGGFEAWVAEGRETDSMPCVNAEELAEKMAKDPAGTHILDVRKQSEFDSEHIEGAVNVPLDYINQNMQQVDRNKTWYVHCAGGYRSMIFTSILRARGFDNLINVNGGFKVLKDTGSFRITDYVAPTTML